MYELARRQSDGPVALKDIAQSQGLSLNYLEQLFRLLKRAGLVASTRGVHGGYILGREPDSITVGDVVRVLDGPLAPSDCVLPGLSGAERCGMSSSCVAHGVWEKVRDAIEAVLDGISLQSLLADGETVPADGEAVQTAKEWKC